MAHPSHVAMGLYADPAISRRFSEYLGGTCPDDVTASYITQADGRRIEAEAMKAPAQLEELLENGGDVDRSLLDQDSLLIHLDIEYVNFDSPAECFLNPHRAFELQQPVINATLEELLRHGISPLHLLTGQGHHFIWRVHKSSPVITELTALAPEQAPSPTTAPDPAIQATARRWQSPFTALGLVIEFLANRIKSAASHLCEIPVELTALHVGRSSAGMREMISIDISEYGDPLWTRVVRMPFTNYVKPWKSGLAQALDIEGRIPPIFTIPFHEIDLARALEIRSNAGRVRELAQRACVRIPEQSQGTARLLESYRSSSLRDFHEDYDRPISVPWQTLGSQFNHLPPCASYIVRNPNDLLLKPSGMKLVIRSLMALNTPPRDIARMIARIFRDPAFDWGHHWEVYSPEMRADFYTRIIAGQILTGHDKNIDFNCVSMQEQGFCFNSHACNLKPWKDRLSTIPLQKHE